LLFLNNILRLDFYPFWAHNTHMLKQTVTLINTPKGCLWAEHGRYYKTQKGAVTAVKRYAKMAAKSPASRGKVMTLLEIVG
jgi:hypothetical protein